MKPILSKRALIASIVVAGAVAAFALRWRQPASSDPTPAGDPNTQAAPLAELGTSKVYDTEFTLQIGSLGSDDKRTLHGVGELVLHEPAGAVTRDVAGRFTKMAVDLPGLPADALAEQRDSLRTMEQGVRTPFAYRLSAAGAVEGIGFGKKAAEDTLAIVRTAVAALQFQPPPSPGAKKWTADEADANGICPVAYEALSATEFVKVKQECHYQVRRAARIDTRSGQAPILGGRAKVRRDDRAVTTAVELEEEVRIPLGETVMVASLKLELRLRDEHLEVNPYPEYTRWRLGPLYAMPDAKPVELTEQEKRKRLQGKTYEQLKTSLETAIQAEDSTNRNNVYEDLSLLFQVEPEAVTEAAKQIRTGMAREPAEVIMGAMATSELPQAQMELVHMAEDESLSTELRDDAISQLSVHRSPSELTLRTLANLAESEPNEALRQQSALALGGAARQAFDDEATASVAAEVVDGLVDRASTATNATERQTALAALGNAGSDRGLSVLEESLASDDPEVRGRAVFSLRFIAGEGAERLLGRVLTADPVPSVRVEAASAVGYRELTPLLAQAAMTAVQAEAEAFVRMEIMNAVWRGIPPKPESLSFSILAWLAENDAHPEIRARAGVALSQSTSG